MMDRDADTVVRPYRPDDLDPLRHLFLAAVRRGTTDHYDAAQRMAWAPGLPDRQAWRDRLAARTVPVAERGGTVLGFMALRGDGYLDLAYVAPQVARSGIGSRLVAEIERAARRKGIARLATHASHPARAFFLRHGWTLLSERTVTRNGIALTNFAMEKPLPP